MTTINSEEMLERTKIHLSSNFHHYAMSKKKKKTELQLSLQESSDALTAGKHYLQLRQACQRLSTIRLQLRCENTVHLILVNPLTACI